MAPPSTHGSSSSKSSSHTARSRRCFGRRVVKRSMGSRRCPSPETTKSFFAIGRPPGRKRPSRGTNESANQRWRTAGGPSMGKRWQQRPAGSTWGDWGDDDELGRINLLTPEKVLQGVAEVQAGISFCLSLPLDLPGGTALNQRRHPPRLAPDRGHGRQRRHVLQRPHERDAGLRRPQVRRRVGRRRRDPLAPVLDAVGLAGPRRRRVRRRRRRRGGGRLLQRLPRGRRPGGPVGGRARRRQRPRVVRPPPGPGAHGRARRAGPGSAGRPAPPPRRRRSSPSGWPR